MMMLTEGSTAVFKVRSIPETLTAIHKLKTFFVLIGKIVAFFAVLTFVLIVQKAQTQGSGINPYSWGQLFKETHLQKTKQKG